MTARQWRIDDIDGGILRTRWFNSEAAFDRALARCVPGKFVGWEVWPTVLEGGTT